MLIEQGPTHFGFLGPSNSDFGFFVPGGLCQLARANGALNVGDAVLYSAVDTVLKTITTTNHKNRVGIVVGGTRTYYKALQGTEAVGLPAAADGEYVIVCYSGVAWAVADAAIALGAKLRLGTTTAGRVITGTDTTDAAAGITGLILGSALDVALAAGDKIRVLVALG